MAAPMNALLRLRGYLCLVLLADVLATPVRAAEVPARATETECPAAARDATTATASPGANAANTIRWSGCQLDVAANGDIELRGDVSVITDGREMHCDRLNYLADTQELKMSGTVRLEDAA